MNYIQDIIMFLGAWNWPLIITFICSGPFLSGLGQIIKKNRKLESWGVIQSMMGALSFLHTTILLWLMNPADLNMIAFLAPGMYGYTQAAYPLIKKIDSGISAFLAGWNNKNQSQDNVLTNDATGETAAPGQPPEATF